MTLTAYQKRIHRLFHSAVEPRPADLGVNADGVEPAPCPRAVAAEVRATVASVLHVSDQPPAPSLDRETD